MLFLSIHNTSNWHYGAPQGEVTIDWGDGEKDFYPSGIPETVSHFYTATVYRFGQVHLARLGKFS